MRAVSSAVFVCLFVSSAFAGQPPSICSVSLVRAGHPQVIGQFQATVAEETETVKTFAVPNTKLKAKVGVYFTDESVRIEVSPKFVQDTSVRIALAVTENDAHNALASSDASIAETVLVSQTQEQNLLRVLKVISIGKEKALIVAECREK